MFFEKTVGFCPVFFSYSVLIYFSFSLYFSSIPRSSDSVSHGSIDREFMIAVGIVDDAVMKYGMVRGTPYLSPTKDQFTYFNVGEIIGAYKHQSHK